MKNFLQLSVIIALFLASCKSNETGNLKDVAQDQVHRKYEVSIDEASGTANVRVVFRFAGDNGTTLRLNSPAKITANNIELNEGAILFGGVCYRNDLQVASPGNKVLLSYVDYKENVLNETFEAGNAAFTNKPDTFHLGRDLSIPFSFSGGDPADDFEIQLRDKENHSISFYAPSNNEKIFEIPGHATDTLAAGELEIQIISHKRRELDNHSTLGGFANFMCSYKPVKVMAVRKKEKEQAKEEAAN